MVRSLVKPTADEHTAWMDYWSLLEQIERQRPFLNLKFGLVYILVDPRNESPRYVGFTTDPVLRRRSHVGDHKSGNQLLTTWKRELQAVGLKPIFQVVDVGDNDTEETWITRLREEGYLLLNGDPGDNSGSVATTQKREMRQQRYKELWSRHGSMWHDKDYAREIGVGADTIRRYAIELGIYVVS